MLAACSSIVPSLTLVVTLTNSPLHPIPICNAGQPMAAVEEEDRLAAAEAGKAGAKAAPEGTSVVESSQKSAIKDALAAAPASPARVRLQ